ncbi:MAG: hypothetical protein U1E29_16095 [Coriobacteriia bacterium]|jgi:hypothetical protein|nr:hypothetical protein [Coriobacteriia bacterium]
MFRSVTLIAAAAAIVVIALVAALAPSCLMPDCAIYGLMGFSTHGCTDHVMVKVIPFGMLATLMLAFVALLVAFTPDLFVRMVSRPLPASVAYGEPPPLVYLSTRLRV